jgi:hypothetical protein
MAWKTSTRTATATTQHTCGGPVFGRKTAGCPRCDELIAGAAPVQWATRPDPRMLMAVAKHDCRVSRCAHVCTFGEW